MSPMFGCLLNLGQGLIESMNSIAEDLNTSYLTGPGIYSNFGLGSGYILDLQIGTGINSVSGLDL